MDLETQAKESAEIIKQGGIIAYPTDTLYGLGVDATNKSAVTQLFAVKQSPQEKNFLVMVRDIDMLSEYVTLSPFARALLSTCWPGALSLLVPYGDSEALRGVTHSAYIGFRMPNHPFREAFFKYCNTPITSTSANISGQAPLTTPIDIREQFPDIGYVVDGGMCSGAPSTVISINDESITLIREGAYSTQTLAHVASTILGREVSIVHADV